MSYYDWNKTLSYDAPITMVIGARGIGKTYGLRVQVIRDFLRHDYRFVEVCRYREEMRITERNYFDRLGAVYPEYAFKIERDCAYIGRKCDNPKNIVWNICGYFIALSSFQMLKKATFNNVKRIIMDECVIDKNDKFHRYLPNEYEELANVVSSVTRERFDSRIKPRLYLLGNACDIINPYFEVLKINALPPDGYTWYLHNTFLLHYVTDKKYTDGMERTLAGAMLTNSDNTSVALENKFDDYELKMIGNKTSDAKYMCTLRYDNKPLAIWCDNISGFYYINDKTPKNSNNVYALTLTDSPNYIVLKRRMPLLKLCGEIYRLRLCRFDTPKRHNDYCEMLQYVGV